jgi:NADH dehydrogenase FAD-containing subunit
LGVGLQALPPVPETELAPFRVVTETGEAIEADMWFRCFGVRPQSDILDAELAAARGADGFLRVRPTLQLEGFDTVFAIGDVTNADAKMAGRAGRQAHLAAENIRLLIMGRADVLEEYEPLPPAIIVPIGPHLGSGQLPNQDDLAPREMVVAAKGNDLMVDRYAEILGVPIDVVS